MIAVEHSGSEVFDIRASGVLAVHATLSQSRHRGEHLDDPAHGGALPLRFPGRANIGSAIDADLHLFEVIFEVRLEGGPEKVPHKP